MNHAETRKFGVNDAGTGEKIDTLLTQGCSSDVHGWQPIETAPKDGTRVLGTAFDEVGGYWRIYSMFWHSGATLPSDWEPFWHHGGLKEHPELWQPLPAPPRSCGRVGS